jgi:hypothetical protein
LKNAGVVSPLPRPEFVHATGCTVGVRDHLSHVEARSQLKPSPGARAFARRRTRGGKPRHRPMP